MSGPPRKRFWGQVGAQSRAGTARAGRAVAQGGRAAWSGAQRFTRAEGAGESGLAILDHDYSEPISDE